MRATIRTFLNHKSVQIEHIWKQSLLQGPIPAVGVQFANVKKEWSMIVHDLLKEHVLDPKSEVESIPSLSDQEIKRTTLYKGLQKEFHDAMRLALAQRDGPAPATFDMMLVLGPAEVERRLHAALS